MSVPAQLVTLPWLFNYDQPGTLEETSIPDNSSSPWLWLSSGGYMKLYGGQGHTTEGDLTSGKWHDIYANSSKPETRVDSDYGAHPCNLFRMPTRFALTNTEQEMTVTIKKYILSASPNRNQTNGIHFFSRYLDQNNTYYIGLRADGYAAIKKKWQGVYQTLASVPVYPGSYNRTSNPILIPVGVPLRLKATTRTMTDSRIYLALHWWNPQLNSWLRLVECYDSGKELIGAGRGGLRLDFMQASLENYRIT